MSFAELQQSQFDLYTTETKQFLSLPSEYEVASSSIANAAEVATNITSSGSVPFEGVEKRLTIVLKPGISARNIPDSVWAKLCIAGGCEIVSKKTLKDSTVYLLSESTLFVTDRIFILKTCGRTVPLQAFKFLLDYYADNCDDLIVAENSRSEDQECGGDNFSDAMVTNAAQKLAALKNRSRGGDGFLVKEGSLGSSTRTSSDDATRALSRSTSGDVAIMEEAMEAAVGCGTYQCESSHLRDQITEKTGEPSGCNGASNRADVDNLFIQASPGVSHTPSTRADSDDEAAPADQLELDLKASRLALHSDTSNSRLLDFVESILFTRLPFIHPQYQVWPHTSFEDERQYLKAILPPRFRICSTVLGSVHAIHISAQNVSDPCVQFRLEEILTLGVEEDCVRRLTGYDNASERQRPVDPQPRHMLKECIKGSESELDEFWFDPCGYSANVLCYGRSVSNAIASDDKAFKSSHGCFGLERACENSLSRSSSHEYDDFNYFSCHISPEPATSYASLEVCSTTNMQNTGLDKHGGSLVPIAKLLSAFNPRKVFVTRVILGGKEDVVRGAMPPTTKEMVCRLSPTCFICVWEF